MLYMHEALKNCARSSQNVGLISFQYITNIIFVRTLDFEKQFPFKNSQILKDTQDRGIDPHIHHNLTGPWLKTISLRTNLNLLGG